jgi:hypothetical protein
MCVQFNDSIGLLPSNSSPQSHGKHSHDDACL